MQGCCYTAWLFDRPPGRRVSLTGSFWFQALIQSVAVEQFFRGCDAFPRCSSPRDRRCKASSEGSSAASQVPIPVADVAKQSSAVNRQAAGGRARAIPRCVLALGTASSQGAVSSSAACSIPTIISRCSVPLPPAVRQAARGGSGRVCQHCGGWQQLRGAYGLSSAALQ